MNICPVSRDIANHCNPPVAAPIQLHPDLGYFNLVKLHCPWYVDSSLIDVVAVAYENFIASGKAIITTGDGDVIFTRQGVEESFKEEIDLIDELTNKLKTDPIEAQRYYTTKVNEMAIEAIYEAISDGSYELADIQEVA
tara:strand:- start:40 stop:456 length:417 start_codon:yes stop_codon:yes gene_type:complete